MVVIKEEGPETEERIAEKEALNKEEKVPLSDDEDKPVYGETVVTIVDVSGKSKDATDGDVAAEAAAVACLAGTGLCALCCLVSCYLVVSSIPLAMVIVGGIHWHDCPAVPSIPILLVVTGSLALVTSLVTSGRSAKERKKVTTGPVECILSLASFVCFIVFCVYVYKNEWPSEDPTEIENYCHPLTWKFGFWFCTLSLGLLALALGIVILGACCWCIAICVFGFNNSV